MPARETRYTISPSNDSTVAIEVFKTGLMRKRKHILFFEQFSGELCYAADRPENSSVNLVVDAGSVVCRDAWLKVRKQKEVTRYVREQALTAGRHSEIRFASTRIASKALRGFVVEGELKICGISRIVKVNVVLSPRRNDSIQVDGDATICLTDFGINPPSSMLGLAGTKNEALIRLLLWALPDGCPF
jgi:polyisoprenoid-binding protein YceI